MIYRSTIKLFTNDASLYLVVDDPQKAADIPNSDLDKIHSLSSSNFASNVCLESEVL